MEKEEKTQQYLPPRGLRYPPSSWGADYAKLPRSFEKPPILRLAEGQLDFPFPEYEDFYGLHAHELAEAGATYEDIDLSPAEMHIRNRFHITSEPFVDFSGGGSYEEIANILLMLPQPPEGSQIFLVGPCFPGIVKFAERYQNLDKDGVPKRIDMRVGAIMPPLNYDLIQSLEYVMDLGKQGASHARRRFEGATLYYINNPGNPKGDSAPLKEIDKFAKFCAEKRAFLVVDEAYGDVLPDEQSAIRLTDSLPNILVLRSASKVLGMPGERIGYMVGSPELEGSYRSYEKEHDLPNPKRILANYILNPDIIRRQLDGVDRTGKKIRPGVREHVLELKRATVDSVRAKGFTVLPTDERTPIFAIEEKELDELGAQSFYKVCRKYGLDLFGGNGYLKTHSGMNDNIIRVRIPQSLDQVETFSAIIESARKEALENK